MAQKKGKGAMGVPANRSSNSIPRGCNGGDDWMYDFSRYGLADRRCASSRPTTPKWTAKRRKDKKIEPDDFVRYEDHRIKWSEGLKLNLQRERYAEFSEAAVRHALYRPFCRRLLYYDPVCNEKPRLFAEVFPLATSANRVISITGVAPEKPFMALASGAISDMHLVGAGCGSHASLSTPTPLMAQGTARP